MMVMANLPVRVMRAWVDQSFPTGLDHRCVHCLICIGGVRPAQSKRCTHTHTQFPSESKLRSARDMGKLLQPNISIPSTTLQKPSHESSMSQIWPPETMMNGKFPVQKIQFDHPSVSLGDQFVCEVLHNNSSSSSGRDTIHS